MAAGRGKDSIKKRQLLIGQELKVKRSRNQRVAYSYRLTSASFNAKLDRLNKNNKIRCFKKGERGNEYLSFSGRTLR